MTAAHEDDALAALADRLLAQSGDPREGLPEPVFRLASQLVPMVNVDLLIQDEAGRTLLTWRADELYGPGWHVPGGIIRFKETSAERIAKVAQSELGCTVAFSADPVALHEVMTPERNLRGHFISLLYACRTKTPPAPDRRADDSRPQNGQWRWHAGCPEQLIRVHEMYRTHIDRPHTFRHD